jgi:hypothetical protein
MVIYPFPAIIAASFFMGTLHTSNLFIKDVKQSAKVLPFSAEKLNCVMMPFVAEKAHRVGLVERCYGWQW